jgi:antitoxin PrlF
MLVLEFLMKAAVLEAEATVTERGQVTLPSPFWKMLSWGKNTHVIFRCMADGTITIQRKDEDSALESFRSFLEAGRKSHPQAICPITEEFVRDAMALVEGVEVDLDAPHPADEPK